jgi:autotransporter translocation and assembly factor TamB
MQIKQQEVALKEKKIAVDAAARADELELKERALAAKMELDGFKAGQQATQAEKKLQSDQEREGVRMGIDIAKSRQQATQKNQPSKGPAK